MGGELYSLLVGALVCLAVLTGVCAVALLLDPFIGWTNNKADEVNERIAEITEAEKTEKEAVSKAEKEAVVHDREIEMLKAENEEAAAAAEKQSAEYEKTIEQLKADKEKALKQREKYMKIAEQQLRNEEYTGGSETIDPPGDAYVVEQETGGSKEPAQPESSTEKSDAGKSDRINTMLMSEDFKPEGYDSMVKFMERTSSVILWILAIVLVQWVVYRFFRDIIPVNRGDGSTEKKEADFSCTKESNEGKETKLGALNISEVTGITFSRDLNEFLSSYSEDWYKISPQLIDANSKESAYRGLDILYKRSILLEENKEYWREIVESPSALVKERKGADMYQLLMISAVKHIDNLEQLASIGIGFESKCTTRTKSIYNWCINTGDRINSLMDAKNGESAEDIVMEFNAETGYAIETEEAKALAYMSRNKKLFKKVFWTKENSGLYDWLNLQDEQKTADVEADGEAESGSKDGSIK